MNNRPLGFRRRLLTLAISLSSVTPLSMMYGPGCLERQVTIAPGAGEVGGATTSVSVVGPTGVTTTGVTTTGDTTTGVTTVGSGPAPTPTAVALLATQLPPGVTPCGFQMCTPPNDMLFIEIASLGNTCQDPAGPQPNTISHWRRGIGLPIQYQAIGTYSMMDAAIYSTMFENDVGPSSNSATTGGGPGDALGTIEVLAVDSTQITIRLTGTNIGISYSDGDYVVPRCM